MPVPVIAYLGSAVTLLLLDVVWLTLAGGTLYKPALGERMLNQPNLAIAGLFYAVYLVGIVIFAVLPAANAQSWLMALGLGALLGLVAYGTYDFTNLATLKDWPVHVALVDLGWGIFVSGAAAGAGYFTVRWFGG